MDYGKYIVKPAPHCLECGEEITYGRTDKKFCSEECKNRHHNHQHQNARNIKRKVLAILDRNHEVLDRLIKAGIEAIWLTDIMTMGFNPFFSTSYRKTRSHDEYGCFDIHYRMTPNRISSISKIQNLSLNLQLGPKEED